MITKDASVIFSGATPNTIRAIAIADQASLMLGYGEIVLTSVKDGKHKVDSKHYSGEAFDFRTRHLAVDKAKNLVNTIRAKIGPGYDVIYEDPDPKRRDDGEHGHVEWDPK